MPQLDPDQAAEVEASQTWRSPQEANPRATKSATNATTYGITRSQKAVDRLFAALEARGSTVRQTGSQWVAQCPAHSDGNPSLSIGHRRTKDGAVLRCHADCSAQEVVEALGLTLRDLYDDRADYRYDDGRVVHRRPGKGFAQSNASRPPTLYHRAQVLDAVKAGEVIYLVEGEKDANSLLEHNVTATTAPQGAANFAKVDVSPLAGSVVVAVVDRDLAGAKWAAQVRDALDGVAAELRFVQAGEGKDASDHLDYGLGVEDFQPYEFPENQERRSGLVLTAASQIEAQPVFWLWEDRLALGTLAVLAGRGGLGKSTLAYWLAAVITQGALPGEFAGQPKSVLVCATEDSWAHTIVPRLIAAGANLDRVYQVEMQAEGLPIGLSLPRDVDEVAAAALEVDAALLVLDPLLSRLSGRLDTHKDAEVRLALEPLARIADQAQMAILGLMHHNKSGSSDLSQSLMGSGAFANVARSVHSVIADPGDESGRDRLFGTWKNNLGRDDLPSLAFTIEGVTLARPGRDVLTSRIVWGAELATSIQEMQRRATEQARPKSAVERAGDWLVSFLESQPGHRCDGAKVRAAALQAGFPESTLKTAKTKLGVRSTRPKEVGQAGTEWFLPDADVQEPLPVRQSRSARGEPVTT